MAKIKIIFQHYLILMSVFFLGRIVLCLSHYQSLSTGGTNLLTTIVSPLRADFLVSSSIMTVFFLFLLISATPLKRPGRTFGKVYMISVTCLCIFIEIATKPFFEEFGVRPNYLFVEYLRFPEEILGMIVSAYTFEILFAGISLATFVVLYRKYLWKAIDSIFDVPPSEKATFAFVATTGILLSCWGMYGFDMSRAKTIKFAVNQTANEIAKNSVFSLAEDIYLVWSRTVEKEIHVNSGLTKEESFQRVKNCLSIAAVKPWNSLRRVEKTHFKRKEPHNLVIILEESFSGEWVESIGGKKGLTPHFSRLSKEGLLLSNTYANGIRSVRALGGIVSGIFSVPGKGVVNGPYGKKDFFTFATLLKPYRYHSIYFSAGKSSFANMKEWFKGNGFDEIVDIQHIKNVTFKGRWGICDEDLLVAAHEKFKALHSDGQRFASLIFTSSNHVPFEFPNHKIEPVKGAKLKGPENSVKYADYALGKFFALARKEQYYENTVFVVIADHPMTIGTDERFPVQKFHIPALILGKSVPPMNFKGIVSQPDVLATAIDLMGIDLDSPVMGHSIYSPLKSDLVLMKHHSSYGLLKKNRIAVLQSNFSAKTYTYTNNAIDEIKSDKELEKDAMAFVSTLTNLYENKLYK